ncbi:MAG: ECF transporter S component [Atribacterota bacterium]
MTSGTRMVTYSALAVGLVTVSTMLLRIPIPQTKGYLNIGDAAIMAIAMLLGPKIGGIGGGLGSALADLLSGYPHWAPFTLVIKGLEGLIVGLFASKQTRFFSRLLILILAGGEMVGGYFLAEKFLYGFGAAVVELPGNLFQSGSSIAISLAFYYAVQRSFPALTGGTGKMSW